MNKRRSISVCRWQSESVVPIKSVPAFSDMRLLNKDRARGVATQAGSCPAIPAASNHNDAAMVQRLPKHCRPQHLSATPLLHLVQDEIAEHLPKRNCNAGKGSQGPKRNLLVAQLDLESIKDETVSEGLVLVQMLVWWLGRSHKHHGQRPLLGHLQGTFVTRQDIGRLECQVKTCLMVMTVGNGQMFNTYPLRNQLR